MKLLTNIMAVASLLLTTSIASADALHFGLTEGYTLLSVGTPSSSHFGGYLQLGSEATIHGDIGSRVNYQLGSGVRIHGNVDGGTPVSIAPSVMVDGTYNVKTEAYWDEIYYNLSHASSVAASYKGTELGTINSNQIFYASSEGKSVFNINGSVNLGAGQSITLKGNAYDSFIINVSGSFTLGSGASIELDGVDPDKVLFNFTGGGFTETATIGAAIFRGTYLAPDMFWQIGDGATLDATNIWASGIQANIQTIYGSDVTNDLSQVPLPGAFLMFGVGLIGLGVKRKCQHL